MKITVDSVIEVKKHFEPDRYKTPRNLKVLVDSSGHIAFVGENGFVMYGDGSNNAGNEISQPSVYYPLNGTVTITQES